MPNTLASALNTYLDTFAPGICDFCDMVGEGRPTLVYTDPETGCVYCLPCLAGATDPANALPELPPTEADKRMCREVVAAHRRTI